MKEDNSNYIFKALKININSILRYGRTEVNNEIADLRDQENINMTNNNNGNLRKIEKKIKKIAINNTNNNNLLLNKINTIVVQVHQMNSLVTLFLKHFILFNLNNNNNNLNENMGIIILIYFYLNFIYIIYFFIIY